jgi:hypothetical protein
MAHFKIKKIGHSSQTIIDAIKSNRGIPTKYLADLLYPHSILPNGENLHHKALYNDLAALRKKGLIKSFKNNFGVCWHI